MTALYENRNAGLQNRSRLWAQVFAMTIALCLSLSAAPLLAQDSDGVAADELLSDRDFFRLATCGAPPGGSCAGPVLRWPRNRVTLALIEEDLAAPPGFSKTLGLAIDQAIKEINRSGAAIRISRVKPGNWGKSANIRVIPPILRKVSGLRMCRAFRPPASWALAI